MGFHGPHGAAVGFHWTRGTRTNSLHWDDEVWIRLHATVVQALWDTESVIVLACMGPLGSGSPVSRLYTYLLSSHLP